MKRKYNYDTEGKFGKRCGHPWCNGCKTRRGNNDGNRRIRHAIKQVLHDLTKSKETE